MIILNLIFIIFILYISLNSFGLKKVIYKSIIEILYLIFLSYLIGSISPSIIIGKFFYSKDIRDHGSGNAGTTNSFRIFGKKVGIIVLIFDILKGFLTVKLISIDSLELIIGFSVIIGHIFPIFSKFKGGKGIATLFGVLLSINIELSFIVLLVFIIVLVISKYISLSSILSTLSFVLFSLFYDKNLFIFSILSFILIILTHMKNIKRLIDNKENKII
jgi:glycerol-3-phosphate acyltransferase PlsY